MVPGGRGTPVPRDGGAAWRGGGAGLPPSPKKSRSPGARACPGGCGGFFAALGNPAVGVAPAAPGAALAPSLGVLAAIGVSPLDCSCPTSRRGQTKSSARPAGGLSASPFTRVLAASASTDAGRDPGPPRS